MTRRLLTIAIFLLAGAVVNVGVAWGCALLIDPVRDVDSRVGQMVSGGAQCDVVVWARPGSTYVEILWIRFGGEPLTDGVFSACDPRAIVPRWARLEHLSAKFRTTALAAPGDFVGESRKIRACGWPMHSLRHEPFAMISRDRRFFRARPSPLRGQPRVVSVRPIWPGFVANTAFYAVILWLLICGPFALRRFIRVKRGLCPACAYPRGESDVCSECGKALPQQAKPTT